MRPLFLTRQTWLSEYLIVLLLCSVAVPVNAEQTTGFVNRSSDPNSFVAFEGYIYFSADDGINGRELWRTDGTQEGTELFCDLITGPLGGDPKRLTALENYLYFSSKDPFTGLDRMWRTDGSREGTGRVRHPLLENVKVNEEFYVHRGILVTNIEDGNFAHVFRTDGSSAGTFLVESADDTRWRLTRRTIEQSHVNHVLSAGDYAVLGFSSGTVYASDLSPKSGWELRALQTRFGPITSTLGDSVFIMNSTTDLGMELYRCKVPEQTEVELVKDINPGVGDGVMRFATATMGDALYFQGDDGQHGVELWRSDGTDNGTYMVLDINPKAPSSSPGWPTVAGSLLYFMADDGVHGVEIWVSDGTREGTHLTADANPGPQGCTPYRFQAVKDTFYFSAETDAEGEELWRSDGTPEGTYLVKDIVKGPGSSEPYFKGAFGDYLVFSASDGVHGFEPWITDGTPEGTRMIADIARVLGENPSSNPSRLTAAGDILYFVAQRATEGVELWCTDGTDSGTRLVEDINPGRGSSNPNMLCAAGDTLYFSASTSEAGAELWHTRGSADTTRMVLDIFHGLESSSPSSMVYLRENQVLFAADDGAYGRELWSTDGTPEGTHLVADVVEGSVGSNPADLTAFNESIYFTADGRDGTRAIWATDGTRAGTRIVKELFTAPSGLEVRGSPTRLTAARDSLYFVMRTSAEGAELWCMQVPGGQASLVKDIFRGPTSSNTDSFCALGDYLYFSAEAADGGIILWRTRGTYQSTVMVRALNGGDSVMNPTDTIRLGQDKIVFAAQEGVHGREPWISDGTVSGTSLLADIVEGEGSSRPADLTAFEGKVYFSADDGIHGRELWVTDGTEQGTRILKDLIPAHQFTTASR